ncbi:AAA family ATPase [Sphingobacterium faecale]|uniref:MoxR family ATPase n=1 Tax=Sphingobacterium faecale TaxID=2803775 RepID=A0ABS1R732_9SPHI|nr:MoxR family ATPase [Sphingobacterium faecale]MBL1410522.1 MoxR family ATPase [Sphingobacterium faecale]
MSEQDHLTDRYLPDFENRIDLTVLQHKLDAVRQEIKKVIVGQDRVINMLLISILAGGHSLIEGLPGVAKTLTAKLIAKTINSDFKRIQFTPDLMPSDVTGSSILDLKTNEFEFRKGPIFGNIILIDEINRAPAKTQASLFECMSEEQVTVDGHTYKMTSPFIVFATQNPIEHEGTYRLPEAQLDRFLFKVDVLYPEFEQELNILKEHHLQRAGNKEDLVQAVLSKEEVIHFQHLVKLVYVHDDVLQYIAQIVVQTRSNPNLSLGASPRASIALLEASKAFAALQGRDFVTPEDVKYVASPILGHRVQLTPEKEMEGFSADYIIRQLVESVEIPR